VLLITAALSAQVSEHDRIRCHTAVRDTPVRCHEYANYDPEAHERFKRQGRKGPSDADIAAEPFPELAGNCSTVTWEESDR